MGCDIHAFIEYYDNQETPTQTDPNGKKYSQWVYSLSDGELDLGRNYTLFGCIAGVRSSIIPTVFPRGLPKTPDLSYQAKSEYYVKILSESDYAKYTSDQFSGINWPYYKTVMTQEMYRSRILWGGTQTEIVGDIGVVPNPAYHSATWLTLSELKEVRRQYLINSAETEIDCGSLSTKESAEMINYLTNTNSEELMQYAFPNVDSPTLYAALCAMQGLEKSSSRYTTRFVCWFDS